MYLCNERWYTRKSILIKINLKWFRTKELDSHLAWKEYKVKRGEMAAQSACGVLLFFQFSGWRMGKWIWQRSWEKSVSNNYNKSAWKMSESRESTSMKKRWNNDRKKSNNNNKRKKTMPANKIKINKYNQKLNWFHGVRSLVCVCVCCFGSLLDLSFFLRFA